MASSSTDKSSCIRTGAEKPRKTDGTMGDTDGCVNSNSTSITSAVNNIVCSTSGFCPPMLNLTASPVWLTRPSFTGTGMGPIAVEAAVCCNDCDKVSFIRPWEPIFRLIVRSGVPAWLYHRENNDKSISFASASAARKSSQVTAWPSWRWKYKSTPRL